MSSADKKKILFVQYSQTGQLARIVDSVSKPLIDSDQHDVKILDISPLKPYPYPWTFFEFFDVFPECVYLDPPELAPLELDANERFDLIIIAYQVWFLAPALPISGFIKSGIARAILKDTPVITLIGCRNMWAMAQNAMKGLLEEAGARLLDNVVLVDQGSSLASFITTPRWLLTGKKQAFWGFPVAGVSDTDIENACRFGLAIDDALQADREKLHQPLLGGLQAVQAKISLIKSEKIGYRSFRIWGRLIRKAGKLGDTRRKPIILIYLIFLIIMIITVVPVNMLLKRLLYPFRKKQYIKLKKQYEFPSGSGSERLDLFKCRK